MTAQRCTATRADGSPCRAAFALFPDGKCLAHSADPVAVERRSTARARGGISTAKKYTRPRSVTVSPDDALPEPASMEDAQRWTAWTTRAVATGAVDCAVAREITGAVKVFLQATEKADLDRRLAVVERQLKERRAQEGARGD